MSEKSIGTGSEQDVNGKSPAGTAGYAVELGYYLLSLLNDMHDPRPFKVSNGSIIGVVPVALDDDETVAEFLDFRWKLVHYGSVSTLVPGMTVFQRAVSLPHAAWFRSALVAPAIMSAQQRAIVWNCA